MKDVRTSREHPGASKEVSAKDGARQAATLEELRESEKEVLVDIVEEEQLGSRFH